MESLFDPWIVSVGIIAWFANSFPAWWPLFVPDKSIPEWCKERRPQLSDHVSRWIAPAITVFGLLLLLAVLWWRLPGRHLPNDSTSTLVGLDQNRQMLVNMVQDHFGKLRHHTVATKEDMTSQVISNQIVFITEIPRGPNKLGYIEGKRFIDCAIIGPAIIGVHSTTEIGFCEILGDREDKDNIESLLVEIPIGSAKWGVIGTRSSSFIRCKFLHVGLAGSKEKLNAIRQSFGK